MDATRMNFNLTHRSVKDLAQVTATNNLSKTEALHRAIAVYKFVSDEINAGRRIRTVGSKGRNAKEIIIL